MYMYGSISQYNSSSDPCTTDGESPFFMVATYIVRFGINTVCELHLAIAFNDGNNKALNLEAFK